MPDDSLHSEAQTLVNDMHRTLRTWQRMMVIYGDMAADAAGLIDEINLDMLADPRVRSRAKQTGERMVERMRDIQALQHEISSG